MPENDLVARSPIVLPPPLAVVAGWEVPDRQSVAPLRIIDCTPLTKVLIRAEPTGKAARTIAVPLGRAQRDAAGNLVVGSGPGEWLWLGPPGTALALLAKGQALAGSEFVSVFDVTHSGVLLRLIGDDAARLLAKVCAIDFDDLITPNGAAFRSAVANIVTDIVRDDQGDARSYLLHCDRSVGQYFFNALIEAGTEFHIGVDGFQAPGI